MQSQRFSTDIASQPLEVVGRLLADQTSPRFGFEGNGRLHPVKHSSMQHEPSKAQELCICTRTQGRFESLMHRDVKEMQRAGRCGPIGETFCDGLCSTFDDRGAARPVPVIGFVF